MKQRKTIFKKIFFQILPEILNNMACILLRLGKVENEEEYLKESKKLIKEELMHLILFFFFWNLLFFFLIFIYWSRFELCIIL